MSASNSNTMYSLEKVKIVGIGRITLVALQQKNIFTVPQLAACDPDEVKINNIKKLIENAADYMKSIESSAAPPPVVNKLVLNGTVPELFGTPTPVSLPPTATATTGEVKTPRKDAIIATPTVIENMEKLKDHPTGDRFSNDQFEESKYLIQDHSWYESKILLPRSVSSTEGHEDVSLREAIVFEMSIEPHDRISFICSWVSCEDSEHNKEKLCSMTYSPQLLFYFNLDLPPLDINIRPEDYEALPNKHTLTNVLWEMHLMQKFKVDM